METAERTARVEALVDHVMKRCLWQFHSRSWDRERQNREILGWAARALCGDAPRPEDRLDRCHWVDGVALARAYQEQHPWIRALAPEEIVALVQEVRARLDFLTITGSLNLELKDHQY